MQIKPVTDPAFRQYGKIIEGIDVQALITAMEKTPCPDGVVYEPSVEALESLDVFGALRDECYGGMPIQLGYCNGNNHALNALEYHKDSELNLACTDMILLIGRQQDIRDDFTYDTSLIEGFLVPAGMLVEMYATTLHYAPVGDSFRCVVVLPRGTNFELAKKPMGKGEGALLTHVNKWLVAHPEAQIEGAWVGLKGENLTA